MPDNTYMGHGLRTDLVEKLKGMSPKFMRFPRGCIVEGTTPSTAMRFRDTVGPAWERPSKLFVWHYRSTFLPSAWMNIFTIQQSSLQNV